MNERTYEIYESIQEQISFFSKMPVSNSEAKIGKQGIIRGLEIALEQIIKSDK
jgi:hypothetical protein